MGLHFLSRLPCNLKLKYVFFINLSFVIEPELKPEMERGNNFPSQQWYIQTMRVFSYQMVLWIADLELVYTDFTLVWASHVALVIKNLSVNAGDIRDMG